MTDEVDETLGRLLREGAPPERDPLFRISVLERRERQRFQRRTHKLLAITVLLAVLGIVGANLGDRLLAVTLISAFCVTLVAASLLSVRGVLLVVHRLRRS